MERKSVEHELPEWIPQGDYLLWSIVTARSEL